MFIVLYVLFQTFVLPCSLFCALSPNFGVFVSRHLSCQVQVFQFVSGYFFIHLYTFCLDRILFNHVQILLWSSPDIGDFQTSMHLAEFCTDFFAIIFRFSCIQNENFICSCSDVWKRLFSKIKKYFWTSLYVLFIAYWLPSRVIYSSFLTSLASRRGANVQKSLFFL